MPDRKGIDWLKHSVLARNPAIQKNYGRKAVVTITVFLKVY